MRLENFIRRVDEINSKGLMVDEWLMEHIILPTLKILIENRVDTFLYEDLKKIETEIFKLKAKGMEGSDEARELLLRTMNLRLPIMTADKTTKQLLKTIQLRSIWLGWELAKQYYEIVKENGQGGKDGKETE